MLTEERLKVAEDGVRFCRRHGYDLTTASRVTGLIRRRCSQCQVVAVNGIAFHEKGCPNDRRECGGCDAIIPATQRYCRRCQ